MNHSHRTPTSRSRRAVASFLGLVAVVLGFGCFAGTLPAAVAEPHPPPSVRPPDPGSQWDPAAAIANGILAKIAGDGLGLVLNQIGIGDKTPQKLDEIKVELGRIQQHLDAMEDRLAHAIAMNHYSDEVHKTDHTRTQIENSFQTLVAVATQAFAVRTAQDDLAKAKTDAEKQKAQQTLDAAMTTYGHRVDEFKASYKDEHIADALGNLNKMLYPYAGADDLVIAYRNVILSDGDIRYLTSAHSESLRTVYTYFEDYESLAAWMTGEYNAAIKLDNAPLAKQFDGYITDQRSKLPTMIPEGVVIDVGQHATTTRDKTVWLPVDGTYTWKSGDTQAPGVYAKVAELNNQIKPMGINTWRMPTQADLGGLFAKYNPGASPVDYLKGIGISKYTAGQFLWTGDVLNRHIQYYWDDVTRYIDVQTRMAASLGGSQIDLVERPGLPDTYGEETREQAQREIDTAFTNTRGSMIALASTGSVDYL